MHRPITERMLLKMQECKELAGETNSTVVPPAHFGYSLSGLYKRGLVAVKNYIDENGKSLLGVYLTQKGLNLLRENEQLIQKTN